MTIELSDQLVVDEDAVGAHRGGLVPPTRRTVRTVAMRPRRSLVRAHRWLSFGLLAWLVVISITGAWLVVHDAVESWLHSERYATTPGDVGLQAASETALAAAGEGSILEYAQTPHQSRDVYKINLDVPVETAEPLAEGEEAPMEYLTYFVDPGSGALNGVANGEQGATAWLYRGHISLWQDNGVFGVFDPESGWCRLDANEVEPGGVTGVICDVIPTGDDMVAWFAVGWMTVLLTGFYLWYWPGVRRWATALVIRRKRGAFAFNMSLHKVIGLVVWVPLLVITFTGAAFAFPAIERSYQQLTPARDGFYLWEAPEDLVSQPSDGRQPLDLDRLAAAIVAEYPGRRVDGITAPFDETGVYTAWVTRGYSPWTREDYGGNVYMALDQYDGSVLYDCTPEDGNVYEQLWNDWSFPLHSGDFGGTTSRVIWVIVGLSPFAFGATGIAMNTIRRRKRRNRRMIDSLDQDSAHEVDATVADLVDVY